MTHYNFRDCEQAENWMTNRETFLNADDVDINEIQENTENGDKKIEALQTFANHLVASKHYATPNIEAKKKEVLERWAHLKDAFKEANRQRTFIATVKVSLIYVVFCTALKILFYLFFTREIIFFNLFYFAGPGLLAG